MGGNKDGSRILRPKNLSTEELLRALNSKIKNLDEVTLNKFYTLLESKLSTVNRIEVGPGTVGVIPFGFKSVSISNYTSETALVDNTNFYSGVSESYTPNGANDLVDEITYDTQLATLTIITMS